MPAVDTILKCKSQQQCVVRLGWACAQMDVAAPGAVEAIAGQLREVLRAAAAGAGASAGAQPQCAPDVALPLVSSEAQVRANPLPGCVQSYHQGDHDRAS